jgi:hypothetical protein
MDHADIVQQGRLFNEIPVDLHASADLLRHANGKFSNPAAVSDQDLSGSLVPGIVSVDQFQGLHTLLSLVA